MSVTIKSIKPQPQIGLLYNIQLRDYFIAHAPAEPWPWFRPVMPAATEQPKLPTDPAWEFTAIELKRAEDWHRVIAFDGRPPSELTGSPRLDSFREQWLAYWRSQHETGEEVKRQRSVQWPGFFADQMLAQRGKEMVQS